MDQEILVEELRKLYAEINGSRGPVALLMLLASEISREDHWNLIVSAKGYDQERRATAIREVTELLTRHLSQANWPQIYRVTVLKTDDPFVRAMNRSFKAENSVVDLNTVNVSGVEIPRALVLQSKAA